VEVILSGVAGVVVGVVAAAVSPSLVSGVGTLVQGATKEVIKGGLVIQDAAAGMFSGGSNYFTDLVNEARAELAGTPAAKRRSARAQATR
jgi:hypothetical protein